MVHLTDEDLLLLSEGELDSLEAATHLSSCKVCASRLAILQRAAGMVAEKLRQNSPVDEAARLRLLAKLEEISLLAHQSYLQRALSFLETWYSLPLFAAFLLVIATGWAVLDRLQQSTAPTYLEATPIPDHRLTPGATRTVQLAEICPAMSDDLDPVVPTSTREAVFREYGVKGQFSDEFQVDYLINPQLGGTDDIRNLWPEPYGSTVWNARAKDALEDRLHQMVCNNQIDLSSAQYEIAIDWISAYQKYFHTSQPVRLNASNDGF